MANPSDGYIAAIVFLPSRIAQTHTDPLVDVREGLGFDDRHVSLPSQDVSIVSGCSAQREPRRRLRLQVSVLLTQSACCETLAMWPPFSRRSANSIGSGPSVNFWFAAA